MAKDADELKMGEGFEPAFEHDEGARILEPPEGYVLVALDDRVPREPRPVRPGDGGRGRIPAPAVQAQQLFMKRHDAGVFPVSLQIPVTLRGDGAQEHADLLQEPGETARPASMHADDRNHLAHRLRLGGGRFSIR